MCRGHKPGVAWSHLELERQEGPPPRSLPMAFRTPRSRAPDLQTCKCFCLRLPRSWFGSMAATESEYTLTRRHTLTGPSGRGQHEGGLLTGGGGMAGGQRTVSHSADTRIHLPPVLNLTSTQAPSLPHRRAPFSPGPQATVLP